MKGKKLTSIHNDHKRFKLKNIITNFRQVLLRFAAFLIPVLLLTAVAIIIYDFGFKPFWASSYSINKWLKIILYLLSFIMGVRLALGLFVIKKKISRILAIMGWVFVLILAFYVMPHKEAISNYNTNRFLIFKSILYIGILFVFVTEISQLLQYFYTKEINPALLFVSSFALLILIGTLLLSLPNATVGGLSKIDAFFTATSAVCVTGLVVVDTATKFTPFGHFILLALIQIGALGIMTFAGLLAYAVAGKSSLKSQLALRDMMSNKQISNIIQFIFRVIFVTLFFELIGAFCIYLSISDDLYDRKLNKIFFSVFHSVSAFCNAGFSTLSNGLYEQGLRYNYTFQFFIAVLVILGGMGFPIVFNLYKYLKVKATNTYCRFTGNPARAYIPRLISLNSRLALTVSLILLTLGFIAYIVFEQNATLAQHPTMWGKIMTSFFGSVTPRTAGFNTVDMTAMSLPTVMIYLLLMWIGASPGSTGGGIKTTTVGVAMLNTISVLRGKDRSEFFKAEISHKSVRHSFAIMVLSLLFIGCSVFFISVNDSDKGLIKIAFEAFSAFSTVGLSLGITPELSKMSKIVLIITMFVGRVGTVTLLVAFIRQSKQLYYRYPKEDITF